MKNPFRKHAPTLGRDRRSVVALEFALIVMPFILTVFCVLETGYDLFCINSLDQATQYAARQIMTGGAQGNVPQATAAQQASMTPAQLQATLLQESQTEFVTSYLCPRLPGLFTCSNLIVNIQVFPEAAGPASGFSSFLNGNGSYINMPNSSNAANAFCLGGAGEYVFIQVMYPMPMLTGVFTGIPMPLGGGGPNGRTVFMLSSTAAFKNEPFPTTSYTPLTNCPA